MKILACSLLSAGVVFFGNALANTPVEIGGSNGSAGSSQQATDEQIDEATALITSSDQLQAHLATTPDSPLYRMPPIARFKFVSSLVFTKRGLGSYSYIDLSGLSVSDAYRILSLFGAQSTIESIPNLQASTALDQSIIGRARKQPESSLIRPQAKPKDKVCYIGPDSSGCADKYGSLCMDGC